MGKGNSNPSNGFKKGNSRASDAGGPSD